MNSRTQEKAVITCTSLRSNGHLHFILSTLTKQLQHMLLVQHFMIAKGDARISRHIGQIRLLIFARLSNSLDFLERMVMVSKSPSQEGTGQEHWWSVVWTDAHFMRQDKWKLCLQDGESVAKLEVNLQKQIWQTKGFIRNFRCNKDCVKIINDYLQFQMTSIWSILKKYKFWSK